MAQILMASLPCLDKTRSWAPVVPFVRFLCSIFCIYVFMLLISFAIFSDRQSLKIENEHNSMRTLTPEVSYLGLASPDFGPQLFKASLA